MFTLKWKLCTVNIEQTLYKKNNLYPLTTLTVNVIEQFYARYKYKHRKI